MTMWNTIFDPLFASWPYLLGLLGIVLAVFAIRERWEDVRFLLLRAWYVLPVVGKAKRLSRDSNVDKVKDWFKSELTLCDDFQSHLDYSIEDPEMFEKAWDYLKKAREIGRRPANVVGWLVIPLLVFVESLGFAYVLAGYTLPGSSESLQIPGAVAIALLISIGLVFLTHMAGREFHWRDLMQEVRMMYITAPLDIRVNLVGHYKVPLDQTHSDDDDRPYIQCIRRIKTNAQVTAGVPTWNVAMLAVIVLVTIGAFYVRYETMMYLESCSALNQGPAATTTFFPDPYQSTLPPVITEPDARNRARGENGACHATEKASIATYIVLAVVFVVVQLIGWTLGYRYGFAGLQSHDAWRLASRFNSEQLFENWLARKRKHIREVAQQHLTRLQRLILRHAQRQGVNAAILNMAQNSGTRKFDIAFPPAPP